MKKLITALMILVVVFCFSACEPENDPTPPTTPTTPTTPADIDGPGTIDITTLDGIYVQTVNLGGKPVNRSVYVIDGNDMSVYETMPSNNNLLPNAAYFDSMSMILKETKTITRNDVTMTCSDDHHEYKLITNTNGTWLVNVEHPDDLNRTFQKVERGHYGTPISVSDCFLKNGAALGVLYDDGKIDNVIVYTEESGYLTNGTTSGNTYTAVSFLEMDSEEPISGAFTVTINGNTATVSVASGFLNEDDATVVSGNYTRYIRTTPWPAAPAAE